ncbi:MAG TPA: dihydrodipicolinate synthase family protein [Dehalococcoidia bacterium]|nr:dihydrodipicolinate synthase family protein [Dehalococcoidia bacterium]
MVDRTMNGIFPILATPFDDKGQIDFEDLEREVEWMIGVGVNGVGIAVASEIYKLTDPERDEVLSSAVKQVNGRVPVVMNTGAMGTDVTVYYSQRAEELGANALMIRPPSFIAMPASEVIEFFARVGASVGIPIFQQDQATAQVPPAMAIEIAKRHENLCYIKVETTPTVPRMAETAALRDAAAESGDAAGDLILFGGAGGTFLFEELRRGSVGTMPGSVIPDVFVNVWERWQDGDEEGAETEFRRYGALIRTLKQPQGLDNWIYKEILVRRGIFKTAHARHPAVKPDRFQIYELEQMLDELELEEPEA